MDTGGWIALLSHADTHHARASTAWPAILHRFHHVVVTNLVIGESYTFLRREVGFAPARALLDRLQATPRTMKREGITHAFGFYRHFLTAGFELIPAG